MIGGYLYSRRNADFEGRVLNKANNSFNKIEVWDNGFLFYDKPFGDNKTHCLTSDELIILSQDFLVTEGSDGEYRPLNLQEGFAEAFIKKGTDALNIIASDFRMVIVDKGKRQKALFLVSNRAGSGRIFYHKLESGILFSSDLRFLLRIIRFDVSKTGIYSILKYGAIPEPITISDNISVVPPAHCMKYDLNSNKYSASPYFKFEFSYGDDQVFQGDSHILLEPIKKVLQKSARFLSTYHPAILLSGGIDSSLYAYYLNEADKIHLQAFYCAFDDDDPELQFAKMIAEKINAYFQVGIMKKGEALNTLEDVVQLTDHPFADFSSLPITFILKYIKAHLTGPAIIIECNGGDDCFGFPALDLQSKYVIKHRFPNFFKRLIVDLFKNSPYWKWESHEGAMARLAALGDVHEVEPMNSFLVQAPVNFLRMEIPREWDKKLSGVMETVFSGCGKEYDKLGYKAKTTIRQLMHINSRLWTAKALSVGESLGLRLMYPYIWHEVLVEQGTLPWNVKIHDGIVKWPLKRLLEEFVPHEFIYREKSGFVPPFARWLTYRDFNHKLRDILLAQKGYVADIVPPAILDELLSDALNGKKLRFPVLNFLWAAVFTEMWIQKYRQNE